MITAQEIIQAYKEIEYKPVRCQWFGTDNDGKVCKVCALSAVLAQKKCFEEFVINVNTNTDFDEYIYIQEKLGISYDTARGIVHGYDNYRYEITEIVEESDNEEYKAGFKIGQETWELVQKEFDISNESNSVE